MTHDRRVLQGIELPLWLQYPHDSRCRFGYVRIQNQGHILESVKMVPMKHISCGVAEFLLQNIFSSTIYIMLFLPPHFQYFGS